MFKARALRNRAAGVCEMGEIITVDVARNLFARGEGSFSWCWSPEWLESGHFEVVGNDATLEILGIRHSGPIMQTAQVNVVVDNSGAVEKRTGFVVKDSGVRENFESGMVRDTGDKPRYLRIFTGPMAQRWAEHLHKGAKKYPDVSPGVPNWTLAAGPAELQRFKESALDHMIKWLNGIEDEDHASGVFFNVNGAEYVKAKMKSAEDEIPF